MNFIYLESRVIWGIKYMHMATLLSAFRSGQKMTKNGTLDR